MVGGGSWLRLEWLVRGLPASLGTGAHGLAGCLVRRLAVWLAGGLTGCVDGELAGWLLLRPGLAVGRELLAGRFRLLQPGGGRNAYQAQ